MLRPALVWLAVIISLAVPIGVASFSPLLQWREPVYIIAGFAGIFALALLLLQPLLAAGYLPGLAGLRGRKVHRWTGGLLATAVVVHVGGLWITSPPDVMDALTFTSPTAFSIWGVTAMWAVFATVLLALNRRHLRPRRWRQIHALLAIVIVTGTSVHTFLIEGAMETISKVFLCALVIGVTLKALSQFKLRAGN